MTKLISIAAAALAMSGAMAMAQTGNGPGAPTKGTATSATPEQRLAPIGHRQPRVAGATSDAAIGKIDPEDAALDRKLKSICRGC
jgi:hypothetical protein